MGLHIWREMKNTVFKNHIYQITNEILIYENCLHKDGMVWLRKFFHWIIEIELTWGWGLGGGCSNEHLAAEHTAQCCTNEPLNVFDILGIYYNL